MGKAFVAIIMGSDSDLPLMKHTADILDDLEIPFEMRIHSVHRTPKATESYIKDADQRGCAVFIAASGLAAHLAGAVAAATLKPVIGVPIDYGPLQGMDALLSTVQMPAGIPVASVAIGEAGAKNAAYLAAQIIGLVDKDVQSSIAEMRLENTTAVLAKDAQLQEAMGLPVDVEDI